MGLANRTGLAAAFALLVGPFLGDQVLAGRCFGVAMQRRKALLLGAALVWGPL
ncbi:hypothetical protein [Acutalibacter intestini]|uniref:hypothetical protein n=1 Tax=Acutalibacter intestini TaxID=3093659 RepID=UPI002AC8CE09|nr:hypothetical protein [Acutalibacter sp. M00204]